MSLLYMCTNIRQNHVHVATAINGYMKPVHRPCVVREWAFSFLGLFAPRSETRELAAVARTTVSENKASLHCAWAMREPIKQGSRALFSVYVWICIACQLAIYLSF